MVCTTTWKVSGKGRATLSLITCVPPIPKGHACNDITINEVHTQTLLSCEHCENKRESMQTKYLIVNQSGLLYRLWQFLVLVVALHSTAERDTHTITTNALRLHAMLMLTHHYQRLCCAYNTSVCLIYQKLL